MWHLALAMITAVGAQAPPPSTFPHNYTGIPAGGYSPEWQDYFLVDSSALTNITFKLPRSFAGSIATDSPGHPNNTLFFWAVEKTDGSLTGNATADEPWLIWLNGGPGSSSFLGFFFENGPIHIDGEFGLSENDLGWNKLVDAIWIDQPVGTGYSTADSKGYVADENQTGEDFAGFLANLVKVFPSLATRPLYLTGESFAGMYIPYITKTLQAMSEPPVQLAKITIGDGSIGSGATFIELSTLTVIETYPQLIDFDPEVFEYFKTQSHLCGYDFNLTYPQVNGTFPPLSVFDPSNTEGAAQLAQRSADTLRYRKDWKAQLSRRGAAQKRDEEPRKRDLTGRANGTIDPWYGCFLFEELEDYALNFTFPWSEGGFDVYAVPDALNPPAPQDASFFMNDPFVRAALHAPQSKNWTQSFDYPFNSSTVQQLGPTMTGDPSTESVVLLTDIASHGLPMVFYSGNADAVVAHRGTEVVIQNFTFGGIQGFSRKPSTPWYDDSGAFAGIVHQERNVTYALFADAGHLVPKDQPARAFAFLREFVLGTNTTGLVLSDGSVAGGENAALAADYLPAGDRPIFYGSATTQFSTVWPKATQDAWNSFIATAAP